MKMLVQLSKFLTSMFASMAQARAASAMARMHRYEEARNIMNK